MFSCSFLKLISSVFFSLRQFNLFYSNIFFSKTQKGSENSLSNWFFDTGVVFSVVDGVA
jgi:hypothetical protein